LRTAVIGSGLVEAVSTTTLGRWLAEDAIKPWRYHSWIFPRAPDFAAKASRVLDLYQRSFQGQLLGDDEYVLSADEKTSIQARCRCHATRPAGPARGMRVEHEYDRGGALAYLAAWDVHHAHLFGRVEPTTGIDPFGRLVTQVMTTEPTPRPSECSGSSTMAAPTAARPRSTGWKAAGGTCAWSTCQCTPPG
jgi:hypothetical protein